MTTETMIEQAQAPSDSATPPRSCSPSRPAVEFLLALVMVVLVGRGFVAEAYIVPTGSMAPTLLGLHRQYDCPKCETKFVVGMDESGRSARPVCPNCGMGNLDRTAGVVGEGDRLLVQKNLYDFRPPRRWEVVVFENPREPGQAYVKRVVGLPGESVQIKGGDVYINGKIARKSLAELRAMRVPVYDHDHPPADVSRFPRWVFRYGSSNPSVPSDWRVEGTGFIHKGGHRLATDWLEYRHWQPDRDTYGPLRDFTPYNGGDLPGEYRVEDVAIEVEFQAGDASLTVRLGGGGDEFEIDIPRGDYGCSPLVRHNGRWVELSGVRDQLYGCRGPARVEAFWVDRRLTVALDGALLFDPIDVDDRRADRYPKPITPALGYYGGNGLTIRSVKLYRDIYYTDALANAPRRPFGVESPYRLGPDEYFVLGDNSPVSNDSRFWPDRPVVTRDRLIGKPFLVHLPSRGVPLKVFGRELYWVPDPREIRYIR